MSAWDATSFGNDDANDWAYQLERVDDLSYIDSTLQEIVDAGDEYIEAPDASEAIAAAEVLAWLLGRPTPPDSFTEKIATWVAGHPIKLQASIVSKALAALDRIQRQPSELPELWEGDEEWIAAMADLRTRLAP